MNSVNQARKRQQLKRRFLARELLIRLKSKPCVDCGETFHHCQMDFITDNENSLRVSDLFNRSQRRMLKEISERDLVCANCGRLRIWKQHRKKRAGPT